MGPVFSKKQRDAYWKALATKFPHVPAELAFENGKSRGPAMKHGTSVLALRYSLDGKHIIAAGGGRLPGCDAAIRMFDAKSGKEMLICRGHVCGIYDLAIDPRSGFLASASEDYSVVLWNLEQQDAIFLVGGDPIVKGHVAFAAQKGLLAIGEIEAYEDFVNSFFVIDLEAGTEVFRQKLRKGKEVAGLAISADGTILIVSVANCQRNPRGVEITCWRVRGGKKLWAKSIEDYEVSDLQFLPGEQQLVASISTEERGNYYYGACLVDAASGKLLAERLLAGIGSNVAASPHGKTIAVAYGEAGIELLQASNLTPLKALVEGNGEGFCSVQFSPDGKTVLAGNAHGQLTKFATTDRGTPAGPGYESTALPTPTKHAAARPEVLALLQQFKQNPTEDAFRMTLAQWCDEHDDPRGEFVRLDCQLANLKDPRAWKKLKKRVDDIATNHEEQWLGPVAKTAISWAYRRGLLHLEFKPRPLLSKAMRAWMTGEAAAWVEGLTVYDCTPTATMQLAMLPLLQNLTRFEASLDAKALKELLPRLEWVTELHLGGGNLGVKGARILADWPGLTRLVTLGLGGTGLCTSDLRTLLASKRLIRLTTLEIQANEITSDGAKALAASACAKTLKHLDLGNNYLLDEGVSALAKSRNLTGLRTLKLWFTAVGSDGAAALARSPYLKNLEELDISANGSLPDTAGAAELRKAFGNRLKI